MKKRTDCRVCGSNDLRIIYDFGQQPLAGEFPSEPESIRQARRLPLELAQCDVCGLLQVINLPPIEDVFHDNYRYSSSTVPALVNHFTAYAGWLAERLPRGASILEFGCNDGVLLSQLIKMGFSCVGVDASDNVTELARAKGVEVHTAFMNETLVKEKNLERKFDLVTCSNVLAHIDDLHSVLKSVRLALKPNGLFMIEVHAADALVRDMQFETVYHEHQSYYTKLTLRRMIESGGFAFEECVNTPMHGGGLRLVCRRADSKLKGGGAPKYNRTERVDGLRFAAVIERCADDIRRAADQYGPLDGYGAAGRAQMFVNMTRTADCFVQVFDDSPLRQGRYIVGTDVPIRPFSNKNGKAVIILAWNYAPSIADRIRDHYQETLTVLPQRTVW